MSAPPTVVTTGHNVAGQAVFLDDQPTYKRVGPGVGAVYGALADGPVDTNDDADLHAFAMFNPLKTSLIPRKGSIVLLVDFPPGKNSKERMYRTLSIDIGVLLDGEVECHLDSGEKRLIRQGEILIQRGTKHWWANPSSTKPARMLVFLLPSAPIGAVQD